MKRFAITVILLYGAILVVLTQPVILASFSSVSSMKDWIEGSSIFTSWRYWIFIAIMLAGQAALLGISVRADSKRPVTKKPVIFPVVASGLLATLLILGIVAAIMEVATKEPNIALGILTLTQPSDAKEFLSDGKAAYFSIAGFLLVWVIWAVVFYRWSKKLEPRTFVEKQCKFLFAGSVLELLVAVPTHIVARSKDYCCAGFSTFVGIALGISVMIISFGPGIFFLYADRWKKLHPQGK